MVRLLRAGHDDAGHDADRGTGPDEAGRREVLKADLEERAGQGYRVSSETSAARPSAHVVHRQSQGGEETPGSCCLPGPGPYRVVKEGIKVMGEAELMAAFNLPPGSIPPGAASNPDFLLSIMAPGASANTLEPIPDAPEGLVESVPEGKVVEMPALEKGLAVGEGVEHGLHHILKHGGEAGEKSVKVFRYGSRLFKVGNYAYSGYRIVTAPTEEEAEKVSREEAGRLGGGALGASGGVEACVVFGVATEGVGFLVCGIVGAFAGEKAGEELAETPLGWVFGKVGAAVWNIVHAPETIMEGLRQLEAGLEGFVEVAGAMGRGVGQVLGGSVVSAREELNVGNWDVRYLPSGLQADVLTVGTSVWKQIEPLPPDGLLTRILQPLASFGVQADVAARIAAATPRQGPGGTQGPTAGDLLAMKPVDFVRELKQMRLSFVQNPDYLAGFGGRWDDEAQLHLRLEPLGALGVPRPLIEDVAAGIEGLPHAGWFGGFAQFGLEPDTLLDLKAPDVVETLRSWAVPIDFRTAPSAVAKLAVQWVRSGFQPW